MAYAKLRLAVRQLKRESLLRRLGLYTAVEWQRTLGDPTKSSPLHPWNASLLAREALLSTSNASGNKLPATAEALKLLSALVAGLEDPLLGGPVTDEALHEFALRAAYQQFPYASAHVFNQLARVRPMFDREFSMNRFRLLSRSSLESVLGGPVDIFVDSAPFFGCRRSRQQRPVRRDVARGPPVR
jgi:hypothetical protein